ncbi:MAG: hypothetical protein ABWZ79_02310 [Pedobacter agri]
MKFRNGFLTILMIILSGSCFAQKENSGKLLEELVPIAIENSISENRVLPETIRIIQKSKPIASSIELSSRSEEFRKFINQPEWKYLKDSSSYNKVKASSIKQVPVSDIAKKLKKEIKIDQAKNGFNIWISQPIISPEGNHLLLYSYSSSGTEILSEEYFFFENIKGKWVFVARKEPLLI